MKTLHNENLFVDVMHNLHNNTNLVGSLRASRVDAEELKYSNHLILEVGDVFAVTINCNFSNLGSGVIELRL